MAGPLADRLSNLCAQRAADGGDQHHPGMFLDVIGAICGRENRAFE
jgi:hypothetical protein